MKICAYCKEISHKPARNIRAKRKKGQIDFYCNRSCASSHFGRGRSKS